MSFDADFLEIMESIGIQRPESDLSSGQQVALCSQEQALQKNEQAQSFDEEFLDIVDSLGIQRAESDLRCDEQVAPREPSKRVRETEGDSEPQQKKAKTLPTQHQVPLPETKAELFEDFFDTLFSMESTEMLTRFCVDFQVPVLSRKKLQACMGPVPRKLGNGGYGTAFLNSSKGLVMKYAKNLDLFPYFLLEAKVMMLFAEHHGFQRLVGVCPEKMCLVSKYAGPTLQAYSAPGQLNSEQRISVVRQVCKILQNMHMYDFVHNDIKPANICIRMGAEGPQVTVIDFGLTRVAGMQIELLIQWAEDLYYAPEICESESPGPCGCLSDVYTVGKVLSYLFEEPQMPQLLKRWFSKSQDASPSERSGLGLLVEALEQESSRQTRRC